MYAAVEACMLYWLGTVHVVTAPHQPRLDWQMWFAALGTYHHNPWFLNLVYRLLMNEPDGLEHVYSITHSLIVFGSRCWIYKHWLHKFKIKQKTQIAIRVNKIIRKIIRNIRWETAQSVKTLKNRKDSHRYAQFLFNQLIPLTLV